MADTQTGLQGGSLEQEGDATIEHLLRKLFREISKKNKGEQHKLTHQVRDFISRFANDAIILSDDEIDQDTDISDTDSIEDEDRSGPGKQDRARVSQATASTKDVSHQVDEPRASRKTSSTTGGQSSVSDTHPDRDSSPEKGTLPTEQLRATRKRRAKSPVGPALVIGTQTKSRKRKRESSKVELIPLSEECGVDQLQTLREEFRRELEEMEVPVKSSGIKDNVRFSTRDIEEIDVMIFGEIMGPAALQRLKDLVDAYTGDKISNQTDSNGIAARAAREASDKENTPVLREFFGLLSTNQRVHLTGALASFNEVVMARELNEAYNKLCNMPKEEKDGLIMFLRKRGFQPTRGRGWASCMQDFLAARLETSKDELHNICQRAKGVDAFVGAFGPGVIPLLPPKIMGWLKKLGTQRMAKVCKLLGERVASFQPICNLVKEHIYDPIVGGAKVVSFDMTIIAGRDDLTLQRRIETAIEGRVMEIE